MTVATLLVELLTEELPPKPCRAWARPSPPGSPGPEKPRLAPGDARLPRFASPRRLAVTVEVAAGPPQGGRPKS